jgi:anti-sigma B factor antagonist
VDGRLTMVDALAFRSAVAEAVGEAATTVVVDLSACAFMDSSGLGAVIAGLKAARQAGGDLRIAAPSTQVLTVLQLTNLERVLRPFGSVAEALRAG